MKKLTAMLLSLMLCFSLLAVPAQAAFTPGGDDPGIIDTEKPNFPTNPGDKDPDKPGVSDPMGKLPEPADEVPGD